MLDLVSVTVERDGTTPVRDVSLHIAPGSFCAILGPSGAGKDTLLRLLAGDVAPSSGIVRCDASGSFYAEIPAPKDLGPGPNLVLLDEQAMLRETRRHYRALRRIHELTSRGATVVAIVRDLDLTAHFADRALLMHRGRIAAEGIPDIVLQPRLLGHIFGFRCKSTMDSRGRRAAPQSVA